MTIINLRGTNGSGKSTIVKQFLNGLFPTNRTGGPKVRECYGVAGPRRPEAYAIDLQRVSGKHLYVLGPYQTATGGLDALGLPLHDVIGLLEKYRPLGHILFEGVVVSTTFGSVGSWMAARTDECIVAYLDTSLDICLKALTQRGANKGTKNVAAKHKVIERTRELMIEAGVRTESVSRENAFDKINSWLI